MAKVNWEALNEVDLTIEAEEQTDGELIVNEQSAADEGFASSGGATVPLNDLRSLNYESGVAGWKLNKNGDVEFGGNKITSTNFTKIFSLKGVSFYVSDGTTPNGNLSGTVGDICYNGPSGQPFYCGGTTTWTGM